MKTRLFPVFASFAILALAAVAPAQDRGRRDRDGSRDRSSSSSSSRSGGSRSDRSDGRSRNDSSRTSRPDRSGGASRDDSSRTSRTDSRPSDTRPDRGANPSRTDDRSGGGRDQSSRTSDRSGSDRTSGGRDQTSRPSEGRTDRTDVRTRDAGSRDPSRTDHAPGSYQGRPSRSGTSGYEGRRDPFDRSAHRSSDGGFGGRTNDYNRYDGRGHVGAVRFGTAPIHGDLGRQIRRSDAHRGPDFAFGGTFGGLRVGYVSYGGGRRDSFSLGFNFGYPYYTFDPYAPGAVCVASPWYRYSYLPPYIDHTRVIVVDNYPDRWDTGGWQTYDARDDRGVQNALDDLRDGFESRDDRAGNRLVPDSGQVAIYNEGRYDYSLEADDFAKMFLDGIDQSKTRRYEIVEVRSRGGEVKIRARHTFEDSWGEEQTVVHTITLRRERGGDYVIREFGSE